MSEMVKKAKAMGCYRLGEVTDRYVYIHGPGGVERLKRCKKVRGCQKWDGHHGCHVT
jgi:hypothetical protein